MVMIHFVRAPATFLFVHVIPRNGASPPEKFLLPQRLAGEMRLVNISRTPSLTKSASERQKRRSLLSAIHLFFGGLLYFCV
jgi:hypothetical protein